jgi:GNAT superfamily N-acetyltransferase
VSYEIRILAANEAGVLANVAPNLFDRGIDPQLTTEFLNDPRHHLAVAIDATDAAAGVVVVVGFASAVHYMHPDKPPELWINEVAVAAAHRNHGIARQLLAALFDRARALGCGEAWVLTNRANEPAMRLYAAAGAEPPRDQVMFSFKLR